ncbi:hypothetical protein LINPERPRIM_LOCUS5775 [Linum perenne]
MMPMHTKRGLVFESITNKRKIQETSLVEDDGSPQRFYILYVCTREGFREKKNKQIRERPEERVGWGIGIL